MDTELFQEWFSNHFLVHVPSTHPVLLLDGQTSHYNPMVLKAAAEGGTIGIIVFCLPPHTTHLLQPLNNGAFTSLKDHWRNECQQFYSQNPGKVLNHRNFVGVFKEAWIQQAMTICNVMAYFHAVGVFSLWIKQCCHS